MPLIGPRHGACYSALRRVNISKLHQKLRTSVNLMSSCTVRTFLGWRLIIGSAEALPILCVRYFRWEREREKDTERDRERERRKWRHHCRAKIGDEFTLSLARKIRTIGDERTLSLAKNSHFSFLPSHFPFLPSRRGHRCGAESQWVHTFHAKNFFALFVPPLSNGTSRATSDRKPKTKWSNPVQSYFVLPIEKMNQINTKNYWK